MFHKHLRGVATVAGGGCEVATVAEACLQWRLGGADVAVPTVVGHPQTQRWRAGGIANGGTHVVTPTLWHGWHIRGGKAAVATTSADRRCTCDVGKLTSL